MKTCMARGMQCGEILKEEYAKNVNKVKHESEGAVIVNPEIEAVMMNVVSGYAPQKGCELKDNDDLWSGLNHIGESILRQERVVIAEQLNGHAGEGNRSDEWMMGRFGIQESHLEGQRMVDLIKKEGNGSQKREEYRATSKSRSRCSLVGDVLWR